MSYQPKVYREQGGDKIVIASGGEIAIQAGGKKSEPVVIETTGAISAYGISVCGSTLEKALYKLPLPTAGAVKYIGFSVSQATGWVNVSSTGAAFLSPGTGTRTYLKAVGNGGVTLAAANASNWYVVGRTTTVGVTSSTTI